MGEIIAFNAPQEEQSLDDMTREELLSYADSSAASAKNAAWITAGVLAVLGILMIIKGGKKPEKQTKA